MFDSKNPTRKRLIIAKAVSAVVALGCSVVAIQILVFQARGIEATFVALSFLSIPLAAWCILYVVRWINRRDDPRRKRMPRDPLDNPLDTF
jgi:hypothetical protein